MRPVAVLLAVSLAAALPALAVDQSSQAPAQKPPGVAKPDLVITSFGLASWGTVCRPGQPLFTFSIGVKNQGTATWSGPDRPVLFVADMHLANPGEFATGAAIDPPIAPGDTRMIPLAVFYYTGNPAHIKAGAPHPFKVTVNADRKIPESDYTNNDGPGPVVWNGMKVIQVGVPQACLPAPKPTLAPHGGAGGPGRVAPPAPTPTLVPIR